MLISRASPTLLTLACPLAQQLTLSSFLWRCIMTIHHTQKVCTLTLFKTCKIGKCARHKCSSLHCTANRANTKLRLIFPCSVVPGSRCFSHCTQKLNLKSVGHSDIQIVVDQVNTSPFITTFFMLSLSPFLLLGNPIRLRESSTALSERATQGMSLLIFFSIFFKTT